MESFESRARKAFLLFDENGDGTISHTELGKVMRAFGEKIDSKGICEVINAFDDDASGTINYIEFSHLLESKMPPDIFTLCYLEIIEETIATRCITCAQLLMLIVKIPATAVEISLIGNYRVELVVRLFSRLIDPHHFDIVSRQLTELEFAQVLHRLGLDFFKFLDPEETS